MPDRQTVPFTAERAEWIRSNVWTPAMRKEHREIPGSLTACPCQWGPSSYCLHGRHGRCRSDAPSTYPETWITDADGRVWGLAHQQVQVWLADRVCRWVCPCGCHTAPAAPVEPVQLDLFAAVDPAPSRVRVYPPGPKPFESPRRRFKPIADLRVTGGVL